MPVDAVVLDASALAALLFGEPAGREVLERIEGRALFAPTLLRYELASVCRKKVRAEPGKKEGLLKALGLFRRLRIDEVQVPPEAMAELSVESRLTAYDAAYLWLAGELDAELVSLDVRLNASGSTGK